MATPAKLVRIEVVKNPVGKLSSILASYTSFCFLIPTDISHAKIKGITSEAGIAA